MLSLSFSHNRTISTSLYYLHLDPGTFVLRQLTLRSQSSIRLDAQGRETIASSPMKILCRIGSWGNWQFLLHTSSYFTKCTFSKPKRPNTYNTKMHSICREGYHTNSMTRHKVKALLRVADQSWSVRRFWLATCPLIPVWMSALVSWRPIRAGRAGVGIKVYVAWH